jgi:DNA-binding transcriptional LysR family regulator
MALAAKENRISSPAVSLAISRLETSLGKNLIVHRRRSLEFTEFGHVVANEAEAIFEALDAFRTRISSKGASRKFGMSHVRIGVARMLATYKFDEVLRQIKEFDPDLKVSLDLADSKQILDRLEDRKLDIALLISDEKRTSLNDISLYSGHFCLVKPKSSLSKSVSYAITESRPEVQSAMKLYRKLHRVEMPVFAEIASWDTIWNWVNKGLCGGVIPDLLLKRKTETRTNFVVEHAKLHSFEVRLYFRKSMANHRFTTLIAEKLSTQFAFR